MRMLKQKGLSLVELMVALVISLILLGGVIEIFMANKETYRVQDGLSRVQENLRFGMNQIVADIQAADYFGCEDSFTLADFDRFASTVENASGASVVFDSGTALVGTDGGANSDSISLLRAQPVSSGLSIRVTRDMTASDDVVTLDSNSSGYARLQQFDMLAVSDCSATATMMITNAPTPGDTGVIQHQTGVTATSGPNKGLRNSTTDLGWTFGNESNSVATALPVRTITYEVKNRPCASPVATNPSVLCVNDNEVVEGITNLQILYGEDTDGDANRTADRFVDATTVGANMNNVTAVRIVLTASSIDDVARDKNGALIPLEKELATTIKLKSRGS